MGGLPNNIMTLKDKAYIAVMRVKKAHAEIELEDYQRVMKYYDPEIPTFDIILNKVVEMQNTISDIDKEIFKV